LEGGNAFDGDGRLREEGEELGKFRRHLSDVVAEIVEDLVGRTSECIWGFVFSEARKRG